MGIDEILGGKREEIFRIAAGREVSPWFPGGLVADLEDLLGRDLDVVEACALRPRIGRNVLAEAVPL